MHVMFNNPYLYVVAYPALNGIEVINKRKGRGVFMTDAAAERFKRELAEALEDDDEEGESIADFIEHFDALMMHPAIRH
ncbi:DUF3567 family protein [Niveibacterium sp. 24ML]|uniref:DUF3567 family protein n=1 Tax=Niveibacterium sp. 24ML TaxID=2985512 RepID=UPI0022722CA4|nr:DUF3567 family protein [Niveibacterium sp. 24ML]MCX9156120.1 DUF3567 family protein [Niveibacterium sp. 24ML]